MEAERNVRLTAEEFVVRISRENTDEFVIAACQLAVEMKGKIKFISDETTIAMLMRDNKSLEDARDYVVLGCASPSSAGRSLDITAGSINFAYILELALNNGAGLSGEQIGLCTGDPRKFTSFDELWDALKNRLSISCPWPYRPEHGQARLRRNVPAPLHPRCSPPVSIRGGHCKRRRKMYSRNRMERGVPNVADSCRNKEAHL